MENSITLQDVAQLAGVHIGTASQALNNRPNVAQDTRMCAVDAARTPGYPIKETSNGTGENPMSIIGLLIKHDYGFPFEVNAFYSYIQAGVERVINHLIAQGHTHIGLIGWAKRFLPNIIVTSTQLIARDTACIHAT